MSASLSYTRCGVDAVVPRRHFVFLISFKSFFPFLYYLSAHVLVIYGYVKILLSPFRDQVIRLILGKFHFRIGTSCLISGLRRSSDTDSGARDNSGDSRRDPDSNAAAQTIYVSTHEV